VNVAEEERRVAASLSAACLRPHALLPPGRRFRSGSKVTLCPSEPFPSESAPGVPWCRRAALGLVVLEVAVELGVVF